MEIKFSPTSELTLNQNISYISNDKPDIALKIADTIHKAIDELVSNYKIYPKIGKNFQQMLLYKKLRFRVLFSVNLVNQKIIIHAVLNTRQNISSLL